MLFFRTGQVDKSHCLFFISRAPSRSHIACFLFRARPPQPTLLVFYFAVIRRKAHYLFFISQRWLPVVLQGHITYIFFRTAWGRVHRKSMKIGIFSCAPARIHIICFLFRTRRPEFTLSVFYFARAGQNSHYLFFISRVPAGIHIICFLFRASPRKNNICCFFAALETKNR